MKNSSPSPSLSGQSLPEVLTSMLLLGILMMISYTALQRGIGLSSPHQQFLHAEMLREMMAEEWVTGEIVREKQGRLLKRKLILMDEEEAVFEVILQCFIGEKLVLENRQIVRREKLRDP